MEFVYRCEIIRLETINILARSVEGSKDHGAEIGTPVVFGNCLGASHWGRDTPCVRCFKLPTEACRTLLDASLHSTGPASIGSRRANSVTLVFSGEPKLF